MREIKFRVWDKHANMFSIRAHEMNIQTGQISDLPERYDIEQFTGLRDKNGKEIYENDIIRMVYIHDEGGGWRSNSKEVGKVYFDIHWGVKFDCVDFSQRTAKYWKLEASSFSDACDVEVIGNIHENPELLRKKQTR